MVKTLIYSHVEYLDVLRINADYIKTFPHKALAINKHDICSDTVKSYDEIYFYDDKDQYGDRLLCVLRQLKDTFIILSQDMDVLIGWDEDMLGRLFAVMESDGLDRIDLQWRDWFPDQNRNTHRIKVDDGTILIKQENIDDFVFNLNPSIWRVATLIELLELHPGLSYRRIEQCKDLQRACATRKCYRAKSQVALEAGYMCCNYFYRFFHLTRHGRWFPPLNMPKRHLRLDQTYIEEYVKIINKYNLLASPRGFQNYVGEPFGGFKWT